MSSRPQRAGVWLVAVALALIGVPGIHVAAAQSLADTDDVLNGARYLVRADDLVVADPADTSTKDVTPKTTVRYFGLDTDDMEITTSDSVAATSVVDLACASHSSTEVPFPQQTQTMRMFDRPNDVIVTFAPTAGAAGTDCSNQQAGAMTFYIDDPGSGARYKSVVSGTIRNRWLHTAVGDFNGDGFDDLFISSDELTYIATAVDVESPSSGVKIVASLQTGGGLTPMADPTVGDFNNDGNLDVAWMGTGFSSGQTPVVHLATVCAGPVANTICAGASPFAIKLSSATITPSAPSGSLVTVGGTCTQNSNNRDSSSETRAPAMAVAAGQFDGTGGDELLVVPLYEDSGKECKVVAEVYSFTQFDVTYDSKGNVTSVSGDQLAPTYKHELDNLGPHGHIGNPSSIYAAAGRMDWSAAKDNVAIAISGGTDHTVLVIGFDSNLMMTSQDDEFSTDADRSFAGLAIGRFSSAPAATSTACSQDSDCTDTCKSSVCTISSFACTTDGDCTGSCASSGTCSYVKPNNYNLQIATFLMARGTDHDSFVFIYGADPDSTNEAAVFPLKEKQEFSVKNFATPAVDRGIRAGSYLRAGDLQGRSQRLGTPTVVRVETALQPELVLAAPPMQADWLPLGDVDEMIFCPSQNDCSTSFSSKNVCNCTDLANNSQCADGSTDAICLTNISALPSDYNSTFAFSDSSMTSKSSTEMSSWSLGVSEKVSEKVKTLTPADVELKEEVSFAASDTYNHAVSKTNSNFEEASASVSANTGLHDFLRYTSRDYNIYYYPVIGQTVCVDTCQSGTCSISKGSCQQDSDCPNDATSCPAADQQQLYVQYSGDTSVSSISADDSTLEWYQPVHEPGQILSYPSSCAELASRYGVNICDPNGGGSSLLSEASEFKTDETEGMSSLKWSGGSSSGKTVSQGGQFSQSLSETVAASVGASEEGAELKETTTINGNEALSTARTNSTSLDTSVGIATGLPGTFLDPGKFAYFAQGYIFGQAPAPGTLQASTQPAADLQTSGTLRSAFTVDVRKAGVGSWWQGKTYNNHPDLALNRPDHLSAPPGNGSSNPALTQCRPVSGTNASTADCVTYDPADPSPSGLWTNGFYKMRGFFITPAASPDRGPQLQQANVGDVLALQARVYNYSLQDMTDASIKVDFYAQEWDEKCATPAGYYDHTKSCSEDGGAVTSCADSCNPCCIANQPVDSLFIGEDSLDPLPGFQSANHPGEPNWAMASTTFDTGDTSICGSGGCGDKYFVFWVVTYLLGQDINGNPALVTEVPDHSLTGIPGQLKSIADLCPVGNSCVNGTCRASGDSCIANSDCPSGADNVCGTDGVCTISKKACTTDKDCGNCLCNLCVEEFSNNVGFYHQLFFIAPPTTGASSLSVSRAIRKPLALLEGTLQLDRVTVSPEVAQPGQKTIVRADLRALGAKINGQIIHFYAIPPDASDLTMDQVFDRIPLFDEEILPHIRADGVYQAQAAFTPEEVGTYHILVTAIVKGHRTILGTTDLYSGVTPPATPTATAPPATPTVEGPTATPAATLSSGNNGGGCAIGDGAAGPRGPWIALVLLPSLVLWLRRRRTLVRTARRPSRWQTPTTPAEGGPRVSNCAKGLAVQLHKIQQQLRNCQNHAAAVLKQLL